MHRDLKRDNLLLKHPPGHQNFGPRSVVICDYGYSYHTEVNPAGLADLPGTLPYIAPEVVKAPDARDRVAKEFQKWLRQLAISEGASIVLLEQLKQLSSRECMERTLGEAGFNGDADKDKLRQHRESMERVRQSIRWPACDVYSSGIILFKLFHPAAGNNSPFPDDIHSENQLKSLVRKSAGNFAPVPWPADDELNTVPQNLRSLWKRLDAHFRVVDAFASGFPARRASAKSLLESCTAEQFWDPQLNSQEAESDEG
jgi:serine/threonine protein kinase